MIVKQWIGIMHFPASYIFKIIYLCIQKHVYGLPSSQIKSFQPFHFINNQFFKIRIWSMKSDSQLEVLNLNHRLTDTQAIVKI